MIRTASSRWQGAVLVCAKCTRRVDGGFGKKGRTSLAKVLRKAGIGGKGRKAALGIVETGCLTICPRRAVVAIDSRRPERWLLVPPGTPTEELVSLFGECSTNGLDETEPSPRVGALSDRAAPHDDRGNPHEPR